MEKNIIESMPFYILLLFFCLIYQVKALEIWYLPGYDCPTFNKQKAEIVKQTQEDKEKYKSIKSEWERLLEQSRKSLEWLFDDAKIEIKDKFNKKDCTSDVNKAIAVEAERIANKIREMKVKERLEIVLLGDYEGAEVVVEVMKLLDKYSAHAAPIKIRQYILLQPNLKHLSECFENVISWATVLPGICVLDANDNFYDNAELLKTQPNLSFPNSLQFSCFASKKASASPTNIISESLQHTNLVINYLALLVLGKECALDRIY